MIPCQKHPEFFARPRKLEDALKRRLDPPRAAGIEAGWLPEMDKDMTCETEMNQFFARNCFSEKEREKVKASLAYQLAVEKNDATQAQEFACRILEGKPLTP
jgi:hypothetical protein